MNIPVFDGHRIVAVAGVGNKDAPYTVHDVTQLSLLMDGMWRILRRKQIEDALRESEQKHRTLYETSRDAILTFSLPDGRCSGANPAAVDLFRAGGETDLLGAAPHELSPGTQPDGASSVDRIREIFASVLSEGSHFFEWQHRRRDGDTFLADVLLTRVALGDQTLIQATVRDITERKRAEQAVRRQSELLTSVLAHIPHSVFWKDRDLNYLGCNHTFARTAGLHDPDEIVGKSDFDLAWTRAQAEACRQLELAVVQEDRPMLDIEQHLLAGDGADRAILTSKVPLHDADGQVTGVLGIFSDITDRKRAEAELRTNEERFRTLVANIPGVVFRCDVSPPWRMQFCSEAALRLTGYPASEFSSGWRTYPSIVHPDDLPMLTERTAQAIENCVPYGVEHRIIDADGNARWVHTRGQATYDSAGSPLWLDGVILDVSERKRAEDALRQSQQGLSWALQAGHGGAWNWNLVTGAAWWSPEMYELWGVEPGRAMDTANSLGLIDPRDRERVEHAIAASISGDERPWEFRIQHPAHGERWMASHARVACGADGAAQRLLGITLDITDRKRAEEVLRLQSSALEAAANGIVLTDRNGQISWVNPAFTRLTGYSRAEAVGSTPRVLRSGHHEPAFYRELWETIQRGDVWNGEIVNRRKDGSLYTEEMTITGIPNEAGEITHFVAVKQDITLRKQAEQALLESETHYRRLYESMTEPYVQADMQGHIQECNEAFRNLLGYSADELRAQTCRDLTPPPWRDAEDEIISTQVLVRGHSDTYAKEFIRKDGSTLPVELRTFLLRDENGSPTGLWAIVRDVSARHAAERALTDAARLQAEVNHLQQDLLGPGELAEKLQKIVAGAVRLFGADFCRIWIVRPGDLCQNGCVHADASDEQHRCPDRSRCLHLLASSGRYTHIDGAKHRRVPVGCYKIGRIASDLEHKFLTNEVVAEPRVHDPAWARELGLVSFAGYQLRPTGGEPLGVLALFSQHVITPEVDTIIESLANTAAQVIQSARAEEEQRSLQSQLAQAQRLESVGQLAAGIAHEINTPTQFVSDNTRFLRTAFPKLASLFAQYQQLADACRAATVSQELLDALEEAVKKTKLDYMLEQIPEALSDSLEGLDRVTRIVRAMKDFAHPGQQTKAPADLNKAIESTVTVARNEWKYVADVEFDLDPALPPVPCLLGDFNQVVLNIVVNAAHAIKESGGEGAHQKGQITISTRADGDQVEIRIRDTGTGIAPEHREHVFDHFFTTKGVGKGTGQGLAMSRRTIVEKHRGSLTFETEVGRGTTFIIRLPVSETPEPSVARSPRE